jgi:hypothetical protein
MRCEVNDMTRARAAAMLIVPMLLLGGCKDTRQQATDYNNRIVGLQEQVVRQMMEFSKSFESNDPALMEEKRMELLGTIKDALRDLDDLEPFEGSTEFRDAARRLLEFYRDTCDAEYKDIIDVYRKSEITQEDVDRVSAINEKIVGKEKDLSDAFLAAQQGFASGYGMKLVEGGPGPQPDAL